MPKARSAALICPEEGTEGAEEGTEGLRDKGTEGAEAFPLCTFVPSSLRPSPFSPILYIPVITIRATHNVMMSRAVVRTLVGYHLARSAVGSGQPSVLCGHNAELNHVSRTSGSCR